MPAKRNDKTHADKALEVYGLLLFGRRQFSLGEIAERLDCTKSTALHVLDTVERRLGDTLGREIRGKELFVFLKRPQALPRISLSAEGLQELMLCRDFLRHLLPKAMRQDLDGAVQAAGTLVPPESDVHPLPRRVLTKGSIDYTPFQDSLDRLLNAIRENKVCVIRYQSSLQSEEKKFDYAPKRLEAYHETLYVSGWRVTGRGAVEALYDTATTLALQRVRGVELTCRASEHLPEPLEESAGAFGVLEQETFEASLRFEARVATYVAERVWSEGQEIVVHKDGSITLHLTSRSADELLSWVLSFGEHAKILKPKWLREELVARLDSAREQYGPAAAPGPEAGEENETGQTPGA